MAIEKRGVLKRERKIKQESEEKNNKDTVIECGAVRRSDMDHEKRRHRRLEARWTWRRMNGENQLDEHKTIEDVLETIGDVK